MILERDLPKVNKPEYRWTRLRVATEEHVRDIFEQDLVFLQ